MENNDYPPPLKMIREGIPDVLEKACHDDFGFMLMTRGGRKIFFESASYGENGSGWVLLNEARFEGVKYTRGIEIRLSEIEFIADEVYPL